MARRTREDYEFDGGLDYDSTAILEFADPGGRSALRAATKNNPRNLPCPNCRSKKPLDHGRSRPRLSMRPLRRSHRDGGSTAKWQHKKTIQQEEERQRKLVLRIARDADELRDLNAKIAKMRAGKIKSAAASGSKGAKSR